MPINKMFPVLKYSITAMQKSKNVPLNNEEGKKLTIYKLNTEFQLTHVELAMPYKICALP